MFSDEYYGQHDAQPAFELESFRDMLMDNGGNDFGGVDFSVYPPPEQFEFGRTSAPADNDFKFDLTDNVSAVVRPENTGPVLRPYSVPALRLDIPPTFFGDTTSINPSLLGSRTQLGRVDHLAADRPAMSNFQVDPALAPQPANNYAFGPCAYDGQHAIPASNPRPSVSSLSTYLPPPPAPVRVARHRNPQPTRPKQDSRTMPPQPSKRRPTIPESFFPYLDVANPPQREGQVPDARGSKDTTIANGYYYRINSPAPLTGFFGKGSDIRYQGPEFHQKVEFTGAEFTKYLRTCPRNPVLVVQLQPQKCNHRYIRGGQSFKCRNKNCPDPNKTIWKGHFRVSITEFYDSEGHWLNPFQSAAGYLHLYCLETMVNLSEVVTDVPVSVCAEARDFQHEPGNPMRLSKQEQRTYQEWVGEFAPKWADYRFQHTRAGLPRDQWPALPVVDEDRLYRRLMETHLQKQNASTAKMAKKRRAKAGGNKITGHIDQLLGDVSKHVAVMKRRRDAHVKNDDEEGTSTQAATGQHPPGGEPSGKRRRLSVDEGAEQPRDLGPGPSKKRQRLGGGKPCHSYNLRSASPRKSRASPLQQFDADMFLDFGNLVTAVLDDDDDVDAQVKALVRNEQRREPRSRNPVAAAGGGAR